MTLREKVIEVYQIRENLKSHDSELAIIEEKLKARKEILSQDKLFNELNDEYMEIQDLRNNLITDFTRANDQLITIEGSSNEK